MTDQAGPETAGRRRVNWRGMLAVLIVIAALGIAIFVVAIYNPVATGQVGAHDNHLLMEIGRDETADPGWEMYVYEFHANTSYYTAFSVRNEGPIAVTVLGLDRSRNVELVPYADPVELRLGTPAGESGGLTEWQASRPLTQTILQPGKELNLWVRWEIGPCAPDEPTPHEADYFLARQSVPLRWSILGVARTTSIKLDYTVAFAVTEKNVRTQCEAGTLRRLSTKYRFPIEHLIAAANLPAKQLCPSATGVNS